ncbi:MAG: efflux RND transporter periplasmic adaptor subunit [Fibromonadales bacterium]|nr:efflux RND transporter periplasmic adaptor subunit [Fibromonadales bacterium]
MKKSWFALILIIATVAGAFGLLNHNKNKKMDMLQKRSSTTMDVPVVINEVGQRNMARSISINGVLQAKKQVVVLSETAGQIERIYREAGDVVWQGSSLALVDATIISTQLATARANLENSKRDLARFKNLAQSGAATQQTVDQLTLAVEAANTNVVALQKQLSNTTVKSPQKGVVIARMVETGSVIGGGSPTFKIADLSQMIMNVGLTEREVVQVKLGQSATIHIDAMNRDFPAVISNVGVAADMSGRYNIEVLISGDIKDSGLRPDLSGSVSFDFPVTENAIVISRNALVSGVKDPKIYLVDDKNKAVLRKIAISSVEGTNVIVESGLSLGERIVVTGHQNLYENASVRILK